MRVAIRNDSPTRSSRGVATLIEGLVGVALTGWFHGLGTTTHFIGAFFMFSFELICEDSILETRAYQ